MNIVLKFYQIFLLIFCTSNLIAAEHQSEENAEMNEQRLQHKIIQKDLYEKHKKERELYRGRPQIGRILSFYSTEETDKTLYGEDENAEGRWIHEGESIRTVAGQRMKIALEDETRMILGPSTEVVFDNWTGREKNNQRIRKIFISNGIVWFKVSKVYSQVEPFVVITRPGKVVVKGTEFVVETGEGGHMVQVRKQSVGAADEDRIETEVHVLEGEVWFARHLPDIYDKDNQWRVLVKAGEHSVVRESWQAPQISKKFDLALFERYFNHAVPDTKLAINRHTTNQARSEDVTLMAFRNKPINETNIRETIEQKNRSIASIKSEKNRGIAMDEIVPLEAGKAYIPEPKYKSFRRNELLKNKEDSLE